MIKLIQIITSLLGFLLIGLLLHEMYHVLTLSKVSEVCLGFGNVGLFTVRGIGDSSEIVGWLITSVCGLFGVWFVNKFN